jgi:hypothetical protein
MERSMRIRCTEMHDWPASAKAPVVSRAAA